MKYYYKKIMIAKGTKGENSSNLKMMALHMFSADKTTINNTV